MIQKTNNQTSNPLSFGINFKMDDNVHPIIKKFPEYFEEIGIIGVVDAKLPGVTVHFSRYVSDKPSSNIFARFMNGVFGLGFKKTPVDVVEIRKTALDKKPFYKAEVDSGPSNFKDKVIEGLHKIIE